MEDPNDLITFECPVSPIGLAARSGRLEVLRSLLSACEDCKSHSCPCRAPGPLHMCCLGGWVDCAKQLIDHGWDVSQKDSSGWTALEVAAYKGHTDMVSFLLKQDSSCHCSGIGQALCLAAEHGNCSVCLQDRKSVV